MYRRIELRTASFQPAAVGSNETKALFTVRAGERVIFASARPDIAAAASTDTTIGLGDGTSTVGYIAAYDTETAVVGTFINGQGALLNQSGGKLYTVDDTVDAIYTGSTYGATNPKVTFTIGVVRDW